MKPPRRPLFWLVFAACAAISVAGAVIATYAAWQQYAGSMHQVELVADEALRNVARSRLEEAHGAYLAIGAFATAGALLVSAVTARWVERRFLGSLASLVARARDVAEGDFRSRIRSERPDEVGDLARAVDAVADRRMAILQQAEEDRGELRAILDNAAEGVVVLGPAGRILLINAAARRIFDAPPDATGRSFVEVMRNDAIQRFLERLVDASGNQQIDVQLEGEDPRSVRLAGCSVRNTKGEEWRTILLATDVSDLRRLERMRVDFVANASHELKTPLAAILGYAETLRDDPELDQQTRGKFLDTIVRNARRLEDLVGDLLRLARLESASASFRFEAIDVVDVVRRATATNEENAKSRGVRILCQSSTRVPPIVADSELVFQCVSNLVSNAVKFTPNGGHVDVLVHLAGDDGIEIQVSDTGVGIPPEHLPRIFERFYRADPSRGREAGGTGLGLAIAKHAATVHGGRIEVESAPGRGSRFRVFLPFAPPGR